jgi:para-aminobenzoate synthetase component 1
VTIQQHIAAGNVYQVNLCRVLATEVEGDMLALHHTLMTENPAPHQGMVSIPEIDLQIATASPELFLRRRGNHLRTSPIKGTASRRDRLRAKDVPENIMIVDLMRNDLARVALTGSVRVPGLLRVEEHPGLVHLVSDVTCEIGDDVTWGQILGATFPPGSVTGAPKSSALRIIDECEPVSREVYCGVIGWIDADLREAELAVAIRTFWAREGTLRFGTGAGITWGSDPDGEWRETQLKARRLCAAAMAARDRPALAATS